MGVRRMVLRQVVRLVRSWRARRSAAKAQAMAQARWDTPANRARLRTGSARVRQRVDTPANRYRAELAAARVFQRYDTPANQLRAAELARRLRSAGVQDR